MSTKQFFDMIFKLHKQCTLSNDLNQKYLCISVEQSICCVIHGIIWEQNKHSTLRPITWTVCFKAEPRYTVNQGVVSSNPSSTIILPRKTVVMEYRFEKADKHIGRSTCRLKIC